MGNKKDKRITKEEIAEYLGKKALKKAMKVAKYSNEKFVWPKKIQHDVSQGVPLDMFSIKAEKKRQRERMAEIEKLKKRREERALKKAKHEQDIALLARERAHAEFQDWEKEEDEFQFEQSKARSVIRIREGRMKPIDVLFKHLYDFDVDLLNEPPYVVFKGLTLKQMEELGYEIRMHLNMDKRQTRVHIDYWESLLVVCNWELDESRNKDALDRARVRGEEPPLEERGLHSSIEKDVVNFLEGKSSNELEALRTKIEGQMSSGSAKVVEYWEVVLKRLHIYKAKARLREIHAKMLRENLKVLEPSLESHNLTMPLKDIEEEEEAGLFSPQLLQDDDIEEAIDPEEDKATLERKRITVQEEKQRRIQEAMASSSKPPPPDDNFELKSIKAMGVMEEGEEIFGSGGEVNLDSQVYWCHHKYRPRKPKYFNRVHTGYEWNKYNQTHYDYDNPPPKTVHGYKFNIFYPDIIGNIKAPTYTIHKDGKSEETCIIRFHAGPPYEDIGFRIVNKEWEYSRKKGFKCTFERGILHLYFNFKRYRYRR